MIATTENIATSKPKYSSPSGVVVPSRPRIRVWLTDDNAGFRDLLEQLLVRANEFDCERQFHSAESLLGGLASEPAPDVILLDVEMGGMTGVDALRLIRALAPDVRVLIVTSFFDPMYESRALRDGASAFLIKAHAPQNLVGEIHRALVSPVMMATPAFNEPASVGKRGYLVAPMQPGTRESTPKKSLVTRLGSWASQLSSNLLRPAPVSTAGSHT